MKAVSRWEFYRTVSYVLLACVMTALLYASLEFFFSPQLFGLLLSPYFFYYYPVANPGLSVYIGVLNSPMFLSMLDFYVLLIFLYVTFFVTMVYFSRKAGRNAGMRDPVIFYSLTVSGALFIVLAITILEEFLGIPIIGAPLFSPSAPGSVDYISLVYAPFAEELSFRIIPLGLLSCLLILRKGQIANHFQFAYGTNENFIRGDNRVSKDAFLAFLAPGHFRRKYRIPLTYADWILIFATSILFGYAHYYFGYWGWGKIIPAAAIGFFLALGYLEFGVYMDIPMHFFFNGVIVAVALFGLNAFTLILLIITGIMIIVSGISYFVIRLKGMGKKSVPAGSGKGNSLP